MGIIKSKFSPDNYFTQKIRYIRKNKVSGSKHEKKSEKSISQDQNMPLKPEIFSSQDNKCSEKMIMGNMKVNNKSVNMSAQMEKDITNAIIIAKSKHPTGKMAKFITERLKTQYGEKLQYICRG